MAQVAKVDDRGRIKIARDIAEPGASVVIIDAKTFFLGIPIGPDPARSSGSWMKTKENTRILKSIAEAEAAKDALNRAKRRRQI